MQYYVAFLRVVMLNFLRGNNSKQLTIISEICSITIIIINALKCKSLACSDFLKKTSKHRFHRTCIYYTHVDHVCKILAL